MKETVNHPEHYGGDTVYEVIKVLEAWLTPEQFVGFCRGNAIKYAARAGKKGGAVNESDDFRKSQWYLTYEDDYRKRMVQGLTGERRVQFKEKAHGGGPDDEG